MKIKQTFIIIVALSLGFIGLLQSDIVLAAKCGGVDTTIIDCPQDGTGTDVSNNGIWGILITIINIMSAGIGVTAVGGVVYGSIMYASGEGNAEKTKKARMIIFNVLIGLLMYAVMYAFLNYMIPGGMFNAVK